MLISLEISNEDMMISSPRLISRFLTMKTTLWMMNACENENRTGQVDFDIVLRRAQRCEMGIPLSFFSETCACQSNRRKSFMRPISVQRILGIQLSVNL